MSANRSELVAIARLNGDFQKNFGRLIGAFLYLRSITAASGRLPFWSGLLVAALSVILAWIERHGPLWLYDK
jgi:hypothetical protein